MRKTQIPIYGYYLDHTIDAINEVMIFVGVGLSGLMHLEIALLALVMYFLMTINVSINAHLKKEFTHSFCLCGHEITFGALDYIGVVIVLALATIHIVTIRADIKEYAAIDPMPKRD